MQLLKRHRDVMYETNPDSSPISAIITTLSGRAYLGEANPLAAIQGILTKMGGLVHRLPPRVPNPVNAKEDFADKWADPTKAHLQLEQNFWAWLAQAQRDFEFVASIRDEGLLREHASKHFKIDMARGESIPSLLSAAAAPGTFTFPPRPIEPKKPAGFA